jgi:nitrogen fixation/metabolism regulation signal transduction histidine kinase
MKSGLLQSLFPGDRPPEPAGRCGAGRVRQLQGAAFLRAPLKASFTLTLSLALLLAVLAAFWAAFYTARRLVQPLRELAEGTQAVAAGQFDKQLPRPAAMNWAFLWNPSTR